MAFRPCVLGQTYLDEALPLERRVLSRQSLLNLAEVRNYPVSMPDKLIVLTGIEVLLRAAWVNDSRLF